MGEISMSGSRRAASPCWRLLYAGQGGAEHAKGRNLTTEDTRLRPQ